MSQTVSVAIIGDTDIEDDESFFFGLSNAEGVAIATSDYTAANGTLTFEPKETAKTITIEVTGDTDVEEDESFFVNLSNSSNATIGDERGIATITDEDINPPVSALDSDIYRFQSTNVLGTYIFAGETESEGIRENFADSFVEEGLAFKVAVEPGDELIPLYRFQSLVTPQTYLHAGESERVQINNNFDESFVEEGLAFYVYGVGTGLATEFTRFQNSAIPGTYLFARPEETQNIRENFPGFIEEGLAFEVGI